MREEGTGHRIKPRKKIDRHWLQNLCVWEIQRKYTCDEEKVRLVSLSLSLSLQDCLTCICLKTSLVKKKKREEEKRDRDPLDANSTVISSCWLDSGCKSRHWLHYSIIGTKKGSKNSVRNERERCVCKTKRRMKNILVVWTAILIAVKMTDLSCFPNSFLHLLFSTVILEWLQCVLSTGHSTADLCSINPREANVILMEGHSRNKEVNPL